MKKLLLLSALFILCVHLNAQITLTQSNTLFTPGDMNPIGAATTGFVIPTAGTNQQWNYANLSQDATYTLNYVTPSSSYFPLATFADTGLSIPFIPGWWYLSDAYYQTNASGSNYLGYVVNTQRTGLLSLTGNSLDSCIFPEQSYTYNDPYYLMPFPATMSTAWHINARNFVNFNLTITAYGLNQTPCQKVTNTVRLDTVVGWGKMRVPTASGPSLAYDVLMVKRAVVQTDSFYLAGAPAPAPLLSAFGVTQGQVTVTNRYMFWRENARYALMMINFGSSNFTTPSGIFYDGDAEYDINLGVGEHNQEIALEIFPNPSSELLNIIGAKAEFEYKIFNSAGVLTKSGIINENILEIQDLADGLYCVSLKSDKLNKVLKFVKN